MELVATLQDIRLGGRRAARGMEDAVCKLGADHAAEATGFGRITHLSPPDAQLTYFAGRHDKLKAPSWEQLVAAIV
jgi:hypothetical protein